LGALASLFTGDDFRASVQESQSSSSGARAEGLRALKSHAGGSGHLAGV
jgi:hypothetical protein